MSFFSKKRVLGITMLMSFIAFCVLLDRPNLYGRARYDRSLLSEDFNREYSARAADLGVKRIVLECGYFNKLITAKVVVGRTRNEVATAIPCSEEGIVAVADSKFRAEYKVDSTRDFEPTLLRGLWKQALDVTFGSLQRRSQEIADQVIGPHKSLLLTNRIYWVDFKCDSKTGRFGYSSRLDLEGRDGLTSVRCDKQSQTAEFEPFRISLVEDRPQSPELNAPERVYINRMIATDEITIPIASRLVHDFIASLSLKKSF